MGGEGRNGAQVKERASKAVPKVKQVKILRSEDRKAADGKPASRGMAFVELGDHEHALCALRSLNNNPAPFGIALLLGPLSWAPILSPARMLVYARTNVCVCVCCCAGRGWHLCAWLPVL